MDEASAPRSASATRENVVMRRNSAKLIWCIFRLWKLCAFERVVLTAHRALSRKWYHWSKDWGRKDLEMDMNSRCSCGSSDTNVFAKRKVRASRALDLARAQSKVLSLTGYEGFSSS